MFNNDPVLQSQFSDLIQSAQDKNKVFSDAAKEKLESLADQISGQSAAERKLLGMEKGCYNVCNNGHMCDPGNPPPNCGNCRKVCV